MPERLPDFSPVLAALHSANVRFVLIGGLAMAAHGSDYVTQDIDIGYSRDTENIRLLSQALAGMHPRLRGFPEGLPFAWDERTVRAAANMTLETDEVAVDILGDIPGVDSFEALWARSIVIKMYGIAVHVASIADLLAMKRAANRPKDQNHILELLELQKLIEDENTQGAS